MPKSREGLRSPVFVGTSANMDKENLLRTIKDQLKVKGMSASEASEKAVGNPYLISNIGRRRYGMPSTDNLKALADVLDLEFYFGPPRDRGEAPKAASEDEFAGVPVYGAGLSAGAGLQNGDDEIIDFLAFRRDWLRKIGVAPTNAVLARVSGESMQPTIWANDMALIDTTRVEIPVRSSAAPHRRSPIYAILDDGTARVKRVERPREDQVILLSDNPDHGPEFTDMETLSIIGKVMWWGHTNRE